MRRASWKALAALLGTMLWGASPAAAQVAAPGGMYPGDPMAVQGAYPGGEVLQNPYDGSSYGGEWYDGAEPVAEPPAAYTPWLEGGYIRAEYLNFSFRAPGDKLLGAPVLGNPEPRQPFTAVDAGGAVIGTARVPDTRPLLLNDNAGVRTALGLDLTYAGTVELGAFFVPRATSSFDVVGLNATNLVGTSTRVNGQIANNIEFYNNSFRAEYRSQFWGADANYIFEGDREGLFQFRPIAGFRYMNLQENLSQRGGFLDTSFLNPVLLISQIDSRTDNRLYGPQFGFKTEINWNWGAIGFENKLGFLANDSEAMVRTFQFRSAIDPEVITSADRLAFSPLYDMTVYARMRVSGNFAVRFGYNFMYLGQIARPADAIDYNDNGPFVPGLGLLGLPAVVAQNSRTDFRAYGINVGGELTW